MEDTTSTGQALWFLRVYKKLLVEGAQRFNLDGTKASLVIKEEVPPKTNKFSKPHRS